jgi:zinc protease
VIGPLLVLIVLCCVLVGAAVTPAAAEGVGDHLAVQRIVSPGGIEAWLVEEKAVPIVALEIAFEAGSRFDSAEKAGLAGLMAGLLDEGAGDLSSEAFKAALEDKAIRMSFGASRDTVEGSLRTLAPYTAQAFRLFALALSRPRFDTAAVERVREQILVSLAQEESDPGSVASKAWFADALAGHPYARPVYGTPASIKSIKRADIVAAHKQALGRDRMKIAVVGAIDAATLARLLDETFGGLPALGPAPAPAPIFIPTGKNIDIVKRDIPQSVVQFGAPGLEVADPDFIPAYVMNYVLGGGGFASRLMEEIREKRGLTYGISTSLSILQGGGLFVGGFSTRNESAGEAYRLLLAEIARMAKDGVSDAELMDAKTYLTGSFALRFNTNDKIANQLLSYQVLGYPIDYINRRNDLVRAVTKADVSRAAARLLKTDAFVFVVVGAPQGLPAAAPSGAGQTP